MNNNPKIMVIGIKQLIYTAIFIILGIILLLILVFAFTGKKEETDDVSGDNHYLSGTYTSALTVGSIPMEVSVKVDSDKIIDLNLSSVGESVEAIYPIISNSFESIKNQVISSGKVENIHLNEQNQYTYDFLIKAINDALKKATVN